MEVLVEGDSGLEGVVSGTVAMDSNILGSLVGCGFGFWGDEC